MSDPEPATLSIPDDNRPTPLAAAAIPMFADPTSQMSFGERAALEGVLGQLKPRVAVEIGTYEGGSLRFLARHSEHVHTLDMYDLVKDRTPFGNVTFHTGDSRVVLPALLSDLEREQSDVDFALIDGDHSADGVRHDLESLLDSSAARSTVIMLHDTMNEEVRSGIERAGISARPEVVYHELDFFPGYEFVGGHFDGQVWGGLGLVITGDRSISGYGESPAQARYRDRFALFHDALRLPGELDGALRQLELNEGLVTAMRSSLSWRMTEPLRWAKRRALALRRMA